MKRVDRYLIRELCVPFLVGQGAVVLMLTGTVLYNNADTFINFAVPTSGVTRIALFFLPYLVNLTMPVATAIAASLAVGRMNRDSEITAMRAAGLSQRRIFAGIFVVGLALSLADFAFGEKVVPWSNLQFERTMEDLSRGAKFLVPQERQVVQSEDRKYTAYIGRMQVRGKETRLYDLTLLIAQSAGAPPTVVHAPEADYSGGRWNLRDARLHFYANGGLSERFVRARTLDLDFRLPERSFNMIALQLPLYSGSATISFATLAERVAHQRKMGWTSPQDLLDLNLKLSVPFSCLVFAIVCPPVAMRFGRAGGFTGVLLSIIVVFVYWNTLLAAKIIGARYPNLLPPLVAAWGQNVVFSALGGYLLWRGE